MHMNKLLDFNHEATNQEEIKMTKRTMLMLSGGIDSTVMAYQLKKEGHELFGVHLNVGQPHNLQDRRAVNLISYNLGMPIEIIEIPNLVNSYKGFLQPQFEEQHQVLCETSRPFIAALSIAGVYADMAGFETMQIAYLKEELDEFASRYANLQDVHSHFENMINAGRSKNFKIETPFMNMSKADVVELGQQLGVPMETTWSCWNSYAIHCGNCLGCNGRKSAFAAKSMNDNTAYLA